MSGDLWQMARNGTTLLPGEAKKLATAYDRLRDERDKLISELSISRLSYQQQDERLAFVEAERDAAEANAERRWEDIILAAKKIDRLQAILAALRDPSNAILEKAWCECPGNFPADHNNVRDVIRVAVAAAEQEVGNA